MSMTLIQHYEVPAGSGLTSVTLSSIPQTHTDLLVLVSSRAGTGGGGGLDLYITFNGSSSGYSGRTLLGTGSTFASQTPGSSSIKIGQWINAATANTYGNASIYLPNYAGSQDKAVSADLVAENNGTLSREFISASSWANSSGISSITFEAELSYPIQQYSSFTIFGITAGSDGTTTVS